MASTFAEASLFCAAAVGAGLLWNALRPGGLSLTENFVLAPPPAHAGDGQERVETMAEIAAREGLQVIGLEETRDYAGYASDPANGILFLDARKLESYEQGHIAGAVCLDPYHLDDHLTPELEQRIRSADVVIIYCTGGTCEDSILLGKALVYRRSLIAPEQLYLYEGGINEWRAQGLPLVP